MKEAVYQTIRERILYLEYEPGQILNEKKLAQEFGVSRSPIKDVLNHLEWEHFVRVIPRTGSMVTEIEFSRAMNVYMVRFNIESFEAGIAESQFSSTHQVKLKELYDSCEDILDKKDPKALAKIDTALREVIHDAAGNPVLADVSDKLYSQTFRLWFSVMLKNGWPDEVDAVKRELEKLIGYFASGNSNEFGTIRRAQLVNHFERLRQKFLGI
ncbi:GntR family transcriptional regulator [Desulfobacula sp.]|uniref:GntR family transcriptional regulator n=1 Tax=Desulfobacula sp. TaxID=2593537 RepID=UPI0025C39142|nr:GntR family transcriptional regulator [Desulfobacula sp.]MBC2705277.1 GntR family transcriptional regulator [Desulfobacula sp.]